MKLHPRLSRAAVELVKRFETFHPVAAPAPGGGWSIGYGHTRTAREGAVVSPADAEALLLYDLNVAAETVAAALYAPVSQTEFEALTAFAFNVGAENFVRSSALARVNAGAALDAADEIERWRHAELGGGPQVVDALVRRRAAEKAHFLSLLDGAATSPTPSLRPRAEGGAAPSATLTAANGIQARLRDLVPDAEPPPAPPSRAHATLARLAELRGAAPSPPPQTEREPAPADADAPADYSEPPLEPPQLPELEASVPGDRSAGLEHEPPPPPFANDHEQLSPSSAPAESPLRVSAPRAVPGIDPLADNLLAADLLADPVAADALPGSDVEGADATPRGRTRRRVMMGIGLIGLMVFIAAAVAIVMGKANLASLVTGLVGVLGMTAGLHSALTGPSPQ